MGERAIIIRIFTLFIWCSVLAASAAHACEQFFLPSNSSIRPIPIMTDQVQGRLTVKGYDVRHITKLLQDSAYIPIVEANKRFWFIVFEHDSEKADLGYYATGRVLKGRFVIEFMDRTTHEEELQYYYHVAGLKEIKTKKLTLKNPLLGCAEMVINANTQVKLWLKHRLVIDDVKDVLDRPGITLAPDARQVRGGRERYIFSGFNRAGKLLRAVVGLDPDCVQTLITAFEEKPLEFAP